MLVAMFNAVKVESVPLNSNHFWDWSAAYCVDYGCRDVSAG